MRYLLLVLVCFPVFAQKNIDQRLTGYIKEFNLKTLAPPTERSEKLFNIGSKLFREQAISGNDNISCQNCHHPLVGTHDGIPLAVGEGSIGTQFGPGLRLQGSGKVLARNTPALFNLHSVNVLFLDGRVELNPETGLFSTPVPLKPDVAQTLKSALAAQALFPMVDHDEMRGQKGSNPIANAQDVYEAWDLIVEKVLSLPGYREAFAEIFPNEKINIGHFGEALAEFQSKAFFYSDTPYDRYIQGNLEALTPVQKLGMDVFFNKGKCGDCHNGEHLSALDFDGVGVPQIGPGKTNGDDWGRYLVDGDEDSKYGFRVPPLRNVGLTAPYFHDGSFKKLEDVVEHYDNIKVSLEKFQMMTHVENYLEPLKDHDHSTNEARFNNLPEDLPMQLNFTEEEEEALVEFLRIGLTDVRLLK
jgi:cytochrome c peroxidase